MDDGGSTSTDLAIVKPGPGEVLDTPASQLISEATLRGIDKFPVGRERRDECAKRRKDVRTALQHLYKVLERIEEVMRIKGDGDQFMQSERKLHARRAQWALDRYRGLLYALRTLEGHDRLCRNALRRGAKAGADDRIAEEYRMLSKDIEVQQARAERIVSALEGADFSVSQVFVWTFLWAISPIMYLGSLLSCSSQRVECKR
mmetsp:Transcript_93531/g.296776  ORF Transcript_93531/g.296776 Transcript_93531/m.296776 type:complete len:203 (-) Transcript_93531:91-699(-)